MGGHVNWRTAYDERGASRTSRSRPYDKNMDQCSFQAKFFMFKRQWSSSVTACYAPSSQPPNRAAATNTNAAHLHDRCICVVALLVVHDVVAHLDRRTNGPEAHHRQPGTDTVNTAA